MEVFTDKMDVNTKISLYEYGIIRNPINNKCVICTNTHELDISFGNLIERSAKPRIKIDYIDIDDIYEAIEEVDDGYFDFIDSAREDELKNLDNNYLTNNIYSLKMYYRRELGERGMQIYFLDNL